MLNRTLREDIVFKHPFSLKGLAEPQPAETYAVEIEEALIEGLSFPAYRRVSTTIARQTAHAAAFVQAIPIDPRGLAAAQAKDVRTDRTWVGAPTVRGDLPFAPSSL